MRRCSAMPILEVEVTHSLERVAALNKASVALVDPVGRLSSRNESLTIIIAADGWTETVVGEVDRSSNDREDDARWQRKSRRTSGVHLTG